MRPATRAEIRRWDELVTTNPDGGQILQTRGWGEFKRRWGWQPSYWLAETSRGDVAVLFLRRTVPLLGEVWYCPKGPGVVEPAHLTEVLDNRDAMADAFLVKVEPEIEQRGADERLWRRWGLLKAPADVQMNRATIIVDIARDEKSLLASFKPKTRYNIRLAARKGVEIEAVPADDANCALMWSLMAQTQERAGFFLRQQRYFTEYWQLQEASNQGQLFFARFHGEVLAGVFATHVGSHGWYKDGGSTKEHSELMAPHLLQWEVMRWLKERRVRTYDLVSVPRPDDLSPDHPLHGLYRFKSGFSDDITEWVGTWDLPLRMRAYQAWCRWGERAAQGWRRRVRRDLLY